MSDEKKPIYGTAWAALTDVERAALILLAEDLLGEDGAIDLKKLSVWYAGAPIDSLASNADPRISEPFLAAIVAIDRAARAAIEPFDMRERIDQIDADGSLARILREARESARRLTPVQLLTESGSPAYRLDDSPETLDEWEEPIVEALRGVSDVDGSARPEPLRDEEDDGQDWLAFEPAIVPPMGGVVTLLANPVEPILATHLAVTIGRDAALGCDLSLEVARRMLVGGDGVVCAELYRVRVPEDRSRPIERGGRIEPTHVYPSVPAVLKVRNRAMAQVTFSAALRVRRMDGLRARSESALPHQVDAGILAYHCGQIGYLRGYRG